MSKCLSDRLWRMVSCWVLCAWASPAFAAPDLSSLAGQRFRYCHNPVWTPFEYSEQGVHRGIFQDYLSVMAQRMGIELVVHPTASWTEALGALQRGDCDFLAGAVQTPEREKTMRFTTPYYNVDYVVVAKQDKPFTASLNSLIGQTLSAPKSGALLGHIARDYPGIRIVPMETAEQQINAITTGQVYGGIGALDELAVDKQMTLYNFKVIHKLDYPNPISVAVRRDLPQLHAAFEAAVQSLTQEDRLQISRRWTPLTITQKIDYTQLLKGLAAGLAVLTLVVVWNRRLQREVKMRRTAEAALTERRQELEQVNQRLQLSLQAGRLGTWEWFSEGRMTWPDEVWLAGLGYAPEELPQTFDGLMAWLHPDDVARTRQALQDCIEGRSGFFEAEFRMRTKSGAWRWVRSGGMALAKGDRGEVTHMAGVHLDFTAQRQSQDAKQAFVSMVSHELRTPLNAVIGLSRRLGQTDLAPQQRDYVHKIDKAAELLLRVINDILDFSRLEAGKFALLPAPFELDEMLGRVMDIVREATDAKGLDLQLEVAPQVPRILVGDGLRLEQVLINLAGNAAKFTDRGQVRIAVDVQSMNAQEVELLFSVHDTGVGMAAAELERVFKPFTQLDAFLTRRHSGTGLGLSISQQLVELMHGRLWAQSSPGQGSCFRFCVPLQIEAHPVSLTPAATPARSPVPASSLRGRRVLLVEDNAFNQQLVAEMLADAGMQVEIAANGLEALEKLAQHKPDLVLMDIQMAVMDGLEASRLIRGTPGLENLPLLAMTAHGMPQMRTQVQAAGLNDFLLKPVEPEQLYAALQRALAPRQPGAEPPSPHSPPALAPLPGLDMDRALRMTQGRHALLALRLQQFLDDLGDSGQRLQALAGAGQWADAERLAHTLKGAAGNVGAMVLSRLADDYLRAQDHSARLALITRIENELTTLRTTGQELAT